MCSLKITSSYYFLYVIINKVFRAPNTGQLASRKGSSRDAGHGPPNTGRPVKYGTSGKPSYGPYFWAIFDAVYRQGLAYLTVGLSSERAREKY